MGHGPGQESEQWGTVPVLVQVQCERFYIKLNNPFVHVLVLAPLLETASVIKPFIRPKGAFTPASASRTIS